MPLSTGMPHNIMYTQQITYDINYDYKQSRSKVYVIAADHDYGTINVDI